jgi:hypothetical protein
MAKESLHVNKIYLRRASKADAAPNDPKAAGDSVAIKTV